MRLPKIHGIIRRRLLINFRVDPAIIQRHLPPGFRPKLQAGQAVAGICLIRLEHVRPKPLPKVVGVSSENAAHRIAITWDSETGQREGVFIPRRDTGSLLNHLAGGRIFPGEHHRAIFNVEEQHNHVRLRMRSADRKVQVEVDGQISADWPRSSIFRNLSEASAFFEAGSLGFSATAAGNRLDAITLHTYEWTVEPLTINHVYSSFFTDTDYFPPASVTFDCALIMRNIAHEWHTAQDLYI